jgi:hypothetical protein
MEKPVAEECFCVNGFSAQKACPQFASPRTRLFLGHPVFILHRLTVLRQLLHQSDSPLQLARLI